MSRRQSQTGGLSIGVLVGALGTILFCCGAPVLVIWQAFSRGGKQDAPALSGGSEVARNNPHLAGRKPVRPQGSRFTEQGVVAAPEIVDELWQKLLGKWQVLPNPDVQATYEFYPDYSFTGWHIINGSEQNWSEAVVSIQDRSVLGPVWNVARPGDRHYLFVYDTPKNMSSTATVTYLKNGTLDMNSSVFWRKSNGTEKLPLLEDILWLQLAGSQWSYTVGDIRHVTEFRNDKTVAVKDVSDRGGSVTRFQGRVDGIRVTPTGFFVNIQVPGQQPSELGEFYFLHLNLRRKDPKTRQTFGYTRQEIGARE
jgi:hypothetical protein